MGGDVGRIGAEPQRGPHEVADVCGDRSTGSRHERLALRFTGGTWERAGTAVGLEPGDGPEAVLDEFLDVASAICRVL